MDPETEAKLASLLMEEARRLRERADKEGVGAYLAKPVVRIRPNPQFMKATVQGVQQANRVVEINEMWRRRSVELNRSYTKHVRRSEQACLRDPSGKTEPHSEKHNRDVEYLHSTEEHENRHVRRENGVHYDLGEAEAQFRGADDNDLSSEEWKDDDMERFLNSRAKRGRGAIGCRMDEPGPYLAPLSTITSDIRLKEDWEARVAGPALKPSACAGLADGLWERRKEKHAESGTRDTEDSVMVKHKRRKEEKHLKKRGRSKDSKRKKRKKHTG